MSDVTQEAERIPVDLAGDLDPGGERSRFDKLMMKLSAGLLFASAPLRWIAIAVCVVLCYFVVVVPLEFWPQVGLAVAFWAFAMFMRKQRSHIATLVMMALSLIVSSRYMFWRLTETTAWDRPFDAVCGIILVTAECYTFTVLTLGYFQTAWPLRRKPIPLPADRSQWPTVDVFIPTYNEPLAVVKPTVYAAIALDYPADKLRIHVLDDGRRPEFKAFCEQVGVNWTIRSHNRHAKAGNINEALKITDGEYLAIFDCDHIPTRSFLQITLGWFLRDKKLAMLQMPHHFFSADPFEKNLGTFRKVPNEGELFYGLVQDGNDLWNATFFCGSCAVLRRTPVLEIGGIAVETVTEDAHTALKLHRRGYSTAYLAIPQAAGLATESLSGHIGQRIRWARGMTQIFRTDNPLTGKGLSLGQRLCYLNAMLHFLYGIPRLVFLTAPLTYLFFGAHVIQASAWTIAAYALPHIIHANITNSRMQNKFRHSFWAEVYESVLASYITAPTLMALINPKLGKFNVTAKGGRIEQSYFDWNISRPYLILLAVNLAGFLVGVGHLFIKTRGDFGTTLMNLAWTAYNMTILGASVAAASEVRQVRDSHRVAMVIRAMLRFANGRTLACETIDYSEGGVAIRIPAGVTIPLHEEVQVSLFRGEEEFVFPAVIVFTQTDRVGVRFTTLTPQQELDFVQSTFSRADAWTDWAKGRKPDTPLRGLWHVLRVGTRGILQLFGHVMADATKLGKRDANKTKKTKLDTGS
ncbi:Cellulose synthase catalytic subunit [UDP-forming] [Pararobbsia alpina]|uniref:UDP-forming cellulose synthase catalytic subunit n=1 Tax=Pararobbsia alpina TaxID=621374 RepID=UPI0039A45307